MIVSKTHPKHPDQRLYMPRRHDRENHAWIPLQAVDQTFADPMDAARECLAVLHRRWLELAHSVKILRALCEHEDFDFDSDVVSSDMILTQTRHVAAALAGMDMDFEHLLDIHEESSPEPLETTAPEPIDDDPMERAATAPVEPESDE